MELKNYFAVLQRWGWLLVVCTALASVTSYWLISQQPKVYQSSSRYLIGPAIDNPNVTSNDLRASGQIGQTYDELVNSRTVLKSTIDKLQLNTSPDALSSQVSGLFVETTQLLTIRANANDPELAASIANTVGDVLIGQSPASPNSAQALRRQDAQAQLLRLQEVIRSTQAEIDQLINQIQQTTDAVNQRALIVHMDERRSQLAAAQRSYSDLFQLLQSSDVNQIKLIEAAVPNQTPIAPNVQQNVLAATIAGFVLGLLAMMLLEYFNDVIYTPEALRKATNLKYLGGLVRHKRLRGAVPHLITYARPETLAAESFRILRANLQLDLAERQMSSLLITSPSRGDGKTNAAANLAVVFARAGKRVVLIDANLRRPQIASIFGLPDQDGLAGLLEHEQFPTPAPVPAVPGLSIVPAGGTVANSSEILGSQRISQFIWELQAGGNVVLIDSAPLWYSDTLALAPQVKGVLLVVSNGTTDRQSTVNAVESLRLVGAQIIGTVLNRVKAGPAYFYYPAFAANRPALQAPSDVATLSAGKPVRALGASKVTPQGDPVVTDAVAAEAIADQGVHSPRAASDDPQWNRAYDKTDDQIGDLGNASTVQANGHLSDTHHRNKNRH